MFNFLFFAKFFFLTMFGSSVLYVYGIPSENRMRRTFPVGADKSMLTLAPKGKGISIHSLLEIDTISFFHRHRGWLIGQ